MTDRPNVLFFDFAAELAENFDTEVTGSVYSVEICVKECPTGIVSHDDLYKDRDLISYITCHSRLAIAIISYPLDRISKRKQSLQTEL